MRKLYYMIKNMVKVAKLLSVDDSGDLRFSVVSSLGKDQKALAFTPYGIMSKPPANSLTILFTQQGQESNLIGMSDDPKNRPLKDLEDGEFAVGNYVTGDYAFFDENGNLNVKVSGDLIATVGGNASITAGTSIEMKAPLINIKTDAFNVTSQTGGDTSSTFSGSADFNGGTLEHNGTDIGDTHRHDGVTTGIGTSGTPV